MMPTAYQTLGIHRESTDEEIHLAWRALAAEHHPDRHPERAEQAAKINQAYSLVKREKDRKGYNDLLELCYSYCKACSGKGVRAKQRGMTRVKTRCEPCHGSGVIA